MRWPAVAALRAAPQFRNALLKLYFLQFRPYSLTAYLMFSSTTWSLLHLNVNRLHKIYKKEKLPKTIVLVNFFNRTEWKTPTSILDLT